MLGPAGPAHGFPEGNALIYCAGAFATTYGKTAHGLVRRSRRYHVAAVIDPDCAGHDAGELLDGRPAGIPVLSDLPAALAAAAKGGSPADTFVIGLAPDGGRLNAEIRGAVLEALAAGLNVDSGLHDFLSEDEEIAALAARRGARLRDVRRTPPRGELHAFSGAIAEVDCCRIAVLGTDSAIGKRTTAWLLVDALENAGKRAELIGTGQTAWLQGARYGIILDALINDFVAGEIEHALVSAWKAERPDALVIEGQGSLLNPAYPGGFEILAAGRPQAVILQHAPARREYDGFPGFPIQPLEHQIAALELISGRPVVAVAVNQEGLSADEVPAVCRAISGQTGRPACAPLRDGAAPLLAALGPCLSS